MDSINISVILVDCKNYWQEYLLFNSYDSLYLHRAHLHHLAVMCTDVHSDIAFEPDIWKEGYDMEREYESRGWKDVELFWGWGYQSRRRVPPSDCIQGDWGDDKTQDEWLYEGLGKNKDHRTGHSNSQNSQNWLPKHSEILVFSRLLYQSTKVLTKESRKRRFLSERMVQRAV